MPNFLQCFQAKVSGRTLTDEDKIRRGWAMGQLGFFDADSGFAAISAKGDPLEMIDRVVPFERFRALRLRRQC